jgi:hypothetical protein
LLGNCTFLVCRSCVLVEIFRQIEGLIQDFSSHIATPYCGTILYPSGYQGHANCQPSSGVIVNVDFTYTGLTQPIDIPIYTGAKGISTGTQYPPGYPTPVTVSAAASTTTEAGGLIITEAGGSTITAASGSIVTSTSAGSSTPVGAIAGGAIAGGVIGGLALVGLIALAAVFLWLRPRKQSRARDSHSITQHPAAMQYPAAMQSPAAM